MKAVVSAFNQEKGPSRGLLRDYEPSDGTFSSTIVYGVSGTGSDLGIQGSDSVKRRCLLPPVASLMMGEDCTTAL